MRWWFRTVMRRALRLFPKPFMLGTPAADFLFQRGHTLQQAKNDLLDTGGRALPVFVIVRDLRLGKKPAVGMFDSAETYQIEASFSSRVFSIP